MPNWPGNGPPSAGVVSESGSAPLRGGVVVDALLGTGLNGPPREGFAQAIQLINGSGLPVLAVDVPSGLNVDTGAASGAAVGADVTVSFIGPKLGLHTGQGLALRGELVHARLGVSPSVLNAVPGCPLLTFDAQSLPSLDTNLYKHRAGHLVVVGGDESMGGAPLMAAEAALCVGTGLVSVVTRGAHRNAILSRRPEIMVQDSANTDAVADLFARATALVIGPGIGRTPWGDTLTRRAADQAPTQADRRRRAALAGQQREISPGFRKGRDTRQSRQCSQRGQREEQTSKVQWVRRAGQSQFM